MFSRAPRRVHSALVAPLLLPFLLLFGAHSYQPVNATDASYSVHGILHGSFPFTDPIFIVSWGAVAHGTLTVAAHFNGFSQESFVYEPNSGYTGDDSFTYHACDSLGQCVDGTITLSVINSPPHAVPDSYTLHGILQHGGDFPVTMNDSDPDHDPIRVVSVTQPSNGTFTYDFLHDSFTYEPRAGFAGTDSVSYTICDSLGLCDSTTITLIVINHPPAANTDNFTMQTNETLFSNGPGVLKNDSDPDNDPFSVSNYTQSAHGHVISLLNDGSLVYEPNQGFIGQDTFNYTVCDYLGACANGVVVIDVQGEAPTPTPTPTPVATPTRTPLPPPPSPTPTPTPTEPLIFIPGIAGSYLVDKTTGAELWPGILTNHDQLSLNPADSPNPNIVATDVIRSVAGTNYYGRLLDVLETRGKYVEYQVSNNPSRRTSSGCDLSQKSGDPTLNPSLFVFAYDWRKSNVENLSTLTDFVGCVQRFFPDQKINILTHSMGSLLARRYILENPGRVKKLITIGGPWLGAPKAIYTLETGDAGFSRLLIWHSTLKRLSEYFKSLHEIIPSESYFDIGQRPFAEVGDFNGNGTPDEKYSYAQLTDLLDRRHGTLPGSNNLAFHSYPGQDNWRFDNSGVEYHHLLGVQHINQTIGRVVASRETVCRRLGFELSCFDRDDFTTSVTHGDRTVPEESATRLGLDDLNARGARLWYYFSLSDRADELVEHTALTELDGLHKRVLFLLGKGPDPGDSDDTVALARPSLEPNLRMDAVNRRASLSEQSVSGKSTAPAETVRANHSKLKRFSPETRVYEGTNTIASTLTEPPRAEGYYVTVRGVDFVSITDEQGNTNTRLDDTFAQPVPNVTYDLIGENAVFVSTPADKTYTIGFQAGTEPINLEIVKGTDNVTPNEARRYRDTALAPGVNAMMRFGLNGIESLRYDADGDGIFETIVGPTATLSGPEAADVNSPSVTITGEAQQTRVLVTINAQDSESGVKTIYYSSDRSRYQPYTGSFLADPSQVTTISAFVDDNAANRSALATYAVPRLPSIMAPPNLGLNTNANETTCGVVVTDDVLGNATAVSNSSGTVTVTRAGVPSNHLFPVGTTTVTYTATDSNGLIATAIQNVTVADKTAPMITCPSRIVAFLPFNSTANSIIVSYPAPSASDNCSASVVTATPSSGSLFPVGTTSAIATASDSAGNAASCSFPVSVLYRFAGFLNPVNNLPTLNAVNAGRAIPIKFSLSGYKGLDIFAASPGSGRIGCSSSTEVELTDTRSAGNSSLSYDHSADLYNYVWKTDKAWAGTCRQFVVQLSDGSIHRANFRLK